MLLPNRRIKWIVAIYPPCLSIANAADTPIFSKPFDIKLDMFDWVKEYRAAIRKLVDFLLN